MRKKELNMLKIDRLEISDIRAEKLSLSPGECVSLSGPSGAGKSLFLRALADLIVARGEVFLDERACLSFDAPQWRRRVTYMGPKASWWQERVGDHFHDRTWLSSKLKQLDLPEDTPDWPVTRLSSGEAQRLCLLRTLEDNGTGAVRYLLLDEPTSALDGERQACVQELLQRYLNDAEVAVLFVSHDERQVQRFATRHWVIESGHVQEQIS